MFGIPDESLQHWGALAEIPVFVSRGEKDIYWTVGGKNPDCMVEMWKKRYSVDDTLTLPHGHAKESCRLIRDLLQSTLESTLNKGPGFWA